MVLELNFVGVNRLFINIYSNEDDDVKRYKTKKCYVPKGIIKNYNVIINEQNFSDRAIDSGIEQYE